MIRKITSGNSRAVRTHDRDEVRGVGGAVAQAPGGEAPLMSGFLGASCRMEGLIIEKEGYHRETGQPGREPGVGRVRQGPETERRPGWWEPKGRGGAAASALTTREPAARGGSLRFAVRAAGSHWSVLSRGGT